MAPLVSILIPAFNAEAWLPTSLRSALDQSWARKEVVVVDDGSSDETLRVARSFESSGVKVVTQENQGASVARNHALRLAQGDYLQWLDADDLLAPDKVECQLRDLLREGGGRVLSSSSWGRFFRRPGGASFRPDGLWQSQSPTSWLTRKMRDNEWMAIESWLVGRESAAAAGPWDESLLRDNDGEYFARVLKASTHVYFTREARSFVRRGSRSSISSEFNLSARKVESIFRSVSLQISHLLELEDSRETRSAALAYLQRWLVYFHPERPDLVDRAQALAGKLGGTLTPPSLGWKFDCLRRCVGWSTARRVRGWSRGLRTMVEGCRELARIS